MAIDLPHMPRCACGRGHTCPKNQELEVAAEEEEDTRMACSDVTDAFDW